MNTEMSILLSFINDNLSVRINKYLTELRESDYQKYKFEYMRLSSLVYDFVSEVF